MSHPNEQSPVNSDLHPYESFETQAQQKYAASNALCSLRHHQQPLVFEPAFSSNDTDGGLDALHTPSSVESSQTTSWSGRQPWIEPNFTPADPEPRDVWSFNSVGNSTSCNPSMHCPVLPSYANPGYGLFPTSWFPNLDQMSTLPQNQLPTPQSEQTPTIPQVQLPTPLPDLPGSFADRPYHHATLLPLNEPTARFQDESERKVVSIVIDNSIATDSSEEMMYDETYAKLIERALLEAPGNRLILKGIYKWFEQNTSKAKDPANKGWQNSVRHNLSMNGAFTKIPVPACSNGSQKGSFWVLEPSAKEHGIQSTTRYRRKTTSNRKKSSMNVHRERSGTRVRCASQKSAKLGMNLQTRQGSTSHRYTKVDDPLWQGRSHANAWGQQQPAPLVSIPVGYAQQYLPSPYFRPTSSNDSFSDVSGDCTSMESEPALPLAPYPQVHLCPPASPALMASHATQPTRDQANPCY